MEAIASLIRSSLVSFLTDKLSGVVTEDTLKEYIDEWIGSAGKKTSTAKQPAVDKREQQPRMEPKSREDYNKLKVADLKNICRERGLSLNGTKANFIDRLLGEEGEVEKPKRKTPVKKLEVSKTLEDEPEKPKRKPPVKKAKKEVPKVIAKIQPENFQLELDSYGNLVNVKTNMVFVEDTVVGRVDQEGNVLPLTMQDVEVCKKHNFSYMTPLTAPTDSDLEAFAADTESELDE